MSQKPGFVLRIPVLHSNGVNNHVFDRFPHYSQEKGFQGIYIGYMYIYILYAIYMQIVVLTSADLATQVWDLNLYGCLLVHVGELSVSPVRHFWIKP